MDTFIFSIDLRMFNASGIGTYLQNLLPKILSGYKNARFNLLCNAQQLRQFTFAVYENVSTIACDSLVYSLSEQLELFKKTPSETDLFWSPHYNIPLLPVTARKRIVTIHDVFHLAFFNQLTLTQKIYAKLMLNAAVHLSNKIITVSHFSKAEIMKYTGVHEGKITVIHNGIDIETFSILKKETLTPIRKKFGLPEKIVLYVGNVKPHKNLKRLLSAYELLIKKGVTDYNLVIVGNKEGFITDNSELFSALEDPSTLRGKVMVTGYIENTALPEIYNSASLFVFPSLYEGFGLPPMEAMACGCPVVVSNAASFPEVCGDAAYYVDPYKTESIAEGMYKALTDESLRQGLIKKGLERVKLFSWEKSAGEHLEVFEEVLKS